MAGDCYVLERNSLVHGLVPPSRERGVDVKCLLLASGCDEVQQLNSGRAFQIGGEEAAAEMSSLGGADGRHSAHDALWDARSIGCALRSRLRAGSLAELVGMPDERLS
uniref:Uncharacterized protein n=2 Tax=Alexandrium monilatum TaxID=311494 RepID=A0A7S4QYR9_9DINO